MKHITFKKTRIAASVSLLLGAGLSASSFAQEAEDDAANNVEIIQVSGIRGSLARAMDMKRESSGVMDAISA